MRNEIIYLRYENIILDHILIYIIICSISIFLLIFNSLDFQDSKKFEFLMN